MLIYEKEKIMSTYVKRKSSDTWHWVRSCSNYPSSGEIDKTTTTRPRGDLCNQCKAKEKIE